MTSDEIELHHWKSLAKEALSEAATHKKSLDMLYGEKFSDRAYRALKSRAEAAERSLSAARGEADFHRVRCEELEADKRRLEDDRNNLRGMFESVTDELWLDLANIDWCDWQDEAQKRGLIVTVTTTNQDFIDEWDSDQMLVYAWSAAAMAAESEYE